MAQMGFRHTRCSDQYHLTAIPGALAIGGEATVDEAFQYALKMHLEKQRNDIRDNLRRAIDCEG